MQAAQVVRGFAAAKGPRGCRQAPVMFTTAPVRPRSRARRLARSVVAGVTVAVVIAAVGFLVREQVDPLIRADDRAIRAATGVTRSHDGLRSALVFWQGLSRPVFVYIAVTAVCLVVWLRRGLVTRAWWAFVTMMVGWNLQMLVKLLVRRARPIVDNPIEHAAGYSFPSGHAANAACGATALVLLVWPLVGRSRRALLIVGSSAFVVVTCLDRVFLGVHFPSDVIAGVLFGGGLVLASYLGYLGWNPATTKTKEAG